MSSIGWTTPVSLFAAMIDTSSVSGLSARLTSSGFGGIKDEKTLEWLAKLCGDHDVTRKSRSSGGLFSGSGQTTNSLQRLPK